jgi:regulator of replication initiation timing
MIDLDEFSEQIKEARSRLDTVNIMNEKLGSVAMRPVRWVVNNAGRLVDELKELQEENEKLRDVLDSLPVDIEELLGS